jgi:hypothetical protein
MRTRPKVNGVYRSWFIGRVRCLGDAAHHTHSLDRIRAHRCLAAQHHRVGPVEDRVGDIARLGARWTDMRDHGFEHLRRGDDGNATRVRRLDNALLDQRRLLQRQFDAQVATRHHHAVRRRQYLVQPLDGLWLLQLGDDGNWLRALESLLGDEPLRLLDILWLAHEAQRDVVHTLPHTEGEVVAIFRRERGRADRHAQQVDALVFGQDATMNDLGDRILPLDL